MSVQAYVLVQTEVGRVAEVAQAIRAVDGVKNADPVAGGYDIIVQVGGPNVDELGALVVSQIQTVPGITRTLTCPVVRF